MIAIQNTGLKYRLGWVMRSEAVSNTTSVMFGGRV